MARQQQGEIKCSLENHKGGTLVRVVGEVAMPPSTDILQRELNRVCAGRPPLVVLDLSEMPFVSSLGIGILIATRHAIGRTGGKVRLVAVQAPVMGVLKRCRADELFQFYEDTETAFVI